MRGFKGQGIIAATALAAGVAATASAVAARDTEQTGDGLDSQLASLFGQEHAALDGMAPDHLLRLTAAPDAEAPDSTPYGAAWLRQFPHDGDAQWECMAGALYHEARGESIEGQFAVAEVILNRVDAVEYPDSICDVVYQGSANGGGCQFSFACDGNSERIAEPGAYTRAGRIAHAILGPVPRGLTDGATHFHTTAVAPRWSRAFERTAQIGAHLFYRQPVRLTSN